MVNSGQFFNREHIRLAMQMFVRNIEKRATFVRIQQGFLFGLFSDVQKIFPRVSNAGIECVWSDAVEISGTELTHAADDAPQSCSVIHFKWRRVNYPYHSVKSQLAGVPLNRLNRLRLSGRKIEKGRVFTLFRLDNRLVLYHLLNFFLD